MAGVPFECPKAGTPEDCGQLHRYCSAHNRTGGPCNAQPMNGTASNGRPRCYRHLGEAPAVVTARYDAERQAQALHEERMAAAAKYGLQPVEDPLTELLKVAAEIIAWKEVCRAMIGDLPEIRYKSGRSGEQLRAELGLWERSLDRTAGVLATIVKLGIEDRLARVQEVKTSRFEAFVDGLLGAFDINCLDSTVAGVVMAHLRALDAGEPPPAVRWQRPVADEAPPPRNPGRPPRPPGKGVELWGDR